MARSGAICVLSLTPLPAAGGVELRHISVDPLNTVVAGYRDTVVAVQDEVEAPYLVEAHRRQLLAPVEDPIYALPPLFHARSGGHEVSIELRTPTDAAHYLSYGRCPDAPMDSAQCPRDPS